MVGLDHAIFCIDRRPFNQGKQVTLNTGTRYVGATDFRTGRDLVDFVQKDNTVLFGIRDGFLAQFVFIDQFGRFFFDKQFDGVL